MQKKNGGIFGGFFSLGGFLGDFSFFFQFWGFEYMSD
jgi:hypothetical protein